MIDSTRDKKEESGKKHRVWRFSSSVMNYNTLCSIKLLLLLFDQLHRNLKFGQKYSKINNLTTKNVISFFDNNRNKYATLTETTTKK